MTLWTIAPMHCLLSNSCLRGMESLAISQPRLRLRWSQLCGRWIGWRMRSNSANEIVNQRKRKVRLERILLEFIWRGRFSAMRGEEYILRNICWLQRCLCSSNSGKRRADGFA